MILALDPSLSATGWAVFDLKGKLFAKGVIKTNSKSKLKYVRNAERTRQLAISVSSLIVNHHVTQIYTEVPVGSKSATAVQALALAQGTVMTVATLEKIPIYGCMARTAKKFLTDDANASKDQMVEAAVTLYPEVGRIKTKYEKEAVADAVGVYKCCAAGKANPLG